MVATIGSVLPSACDRWFLEEGEDGTRSTWPPAHRGDARHVGRVGSCSGRWFDLRKSHGCIGRGSARCHRHRHRAQGQQPLVQRTTESGAYQFPTVPVGTYSVTFEMSGFKKSVRNDIIITIGFNAGIDQKLEIGAMTEEVTVSGESPVVDLKKTTTGGVFDADVLEKIPTARDPWQIVNMAAGVQLSGYNVGGSASGGQQTISIGARHHGERELERGRRVDHRPVVQLLRDLLQLRFVRPDPGDDRWRRRVGPDERRQHQPDHEERQQRVQGIGNGTFENDKMQSDNVTEELFNDGATGSCRATRSSASACDRSKSAGRSSRTASGGGWQRRPPGHQHRRH